MSTPQARVSVAAELRLFLKPAHRTGPVWVGCDGVSSLGHLVQSLGVPLTEVGRLVVNGRPVPPRYRPAGGDVVEVGAVDRPQPVPVHRFVLDVHLGTLARRLRLAGIDTAYANDAGDDALIEQANTARRILLTQDRGLLRRRAPWLAAYVYGARPDDQFADVLDRFTPPLAPWTRCPACNGLLSPVAKAEVEPLLRPGTRRTYQEFSRCGACGQVYWRGAHAKRLEALIASARRAAHTVTPRRFLP
ncbi:MAG: Mut7-C ubiquitin/RNAse domain-containing protein [Actinobacteria bacterium]|nr:Mut7-C ubiquitin/RNAse domain-containing protein [Actinomycetota bacterium]